MVITIQSKRAKVSRYLRSPHAVAHQVSQRDRDLLDTFTLFPFLTAAQLCRLVFGSESALSYCRDRLKKLWHARLLERVYLRRSVYGSPLAVYTLKHRNAVERSFLFLEHTLEIANFAIAVRSYCESDGVELSQLLLEGSLRRQPVRVRDGSRDVAVIPDAYVRLLLRRDGRAYELGWAVEIDRATVPGRAFRRKVRRLLAYAEGPYQAWAQSSALTIVVITTGGEKRLEMLTRAVEEELLANGAADQGDLFRLASAHLEAIDPVALVRDRRFRIPFMVGLVPLLPEA